MIMIDARLYESIKIWILIRYIHCFKDTSVRENLQLRDPSIEVYMSLNWRIFSLFHLAAALGYLCVVWYKRYDNKFINLYSFQKVF